MRINTDSVIWMKPGGIQQQQKKKQNSLNELATWSQIDDTYAPDI